jgi:hypothetical protein
MHARMRSRAAAALVFGVLLAGCGAAAGPGTVANPTQAAGGAIQTESLSQTQAVASGSTARGFDCATLITPAELDALSGFKGGSVTTTTRGDQNTEKPGYGECAFEEPSASSFFGSIAISSGDAIDGYTAGHDYNKAHGGTPLSGLGVDAILVRTDAGLGVFSLSGDGVGIQVGLAFDSTETPVDAAKTAIEKIAQTVLGRV